MYTAGVLVSHMKSNFMPLLLWSHPITYVYSRCVSVTYEVKLHAFITMEPSYYICIQQVLVSHMKSNFMPLLLWSHPITYVYSRCVSVTYEVKLHAFITMEPSYYICIQQVC